MDTENLTLLTNEEIQMVNGAGGAYDVGYFVGYVLGGGAGRDLGYWIYDSTH